MNKKGDIVNRENKNSYKRLINVSRIGAIVCFIALAAVVMFLGLKDFNELAVFLFTLGFINLWLWIFCKNKESKRG